MAKGGRYLNTNKSEKKKGKGLKILVIVLLVLALLIGGGYFAFRSVMGSMLGNVKRAEFEEKNQDKSYEDLVAEMYGGMDVPGGEASGGEEDVYVPEGAEDDDVYVPEDIMSAPSEETQQG